MNTRPFNPAGNRTIDGAIIVPGLRVIDYDMAVGTVVADEHDGDYGNPDNHWFRVIRDHIPHMTGPNRHGGFTVMDGGRLWTRHPDSRRHIAPGPAIPEYGIKAGVRLAVTFEDQMDRWRINTYTPEGGEVIDALDFETGEDYAQWRALNPNVPIMLITITETVRSLIECDWCQVATPTAEGKDGNHYCVVCARPESR